MVLRRRAGADQFDPSVRLSREDFAARMGADAADPEVVTATLGGLGLRVSSTDLPSRRVRVAGSTAALSRLFGTQLEAVTSRAVDGAEVQHRNRSGMLMVPTSLDGIITALLGLDDRPQSLAELRIAEARTVAVSYTPLDLADVYRFPPRFDGAGQTIAIIELGGGFAQAQLDTYFADLGIAGPKVTAVGISWGRNEDAWTAQAMHSLDQAFVDAASLGITVTAAAGDNGSSDGASDGRDHADFPASSPHVLACGGTSLQASSGIVTSETVWNNGSGAGQPGAV